MENPFKIPDNYFSFLKKEIKNKTYSYDFNFLVPNNYWSSLKESIFNKTINNKKNIFSLKSNLFYIAASITIILGLIFIYKFTKNIYEPSKNTVSPLISTKNNGLNMVDINKAELVNPNSMVSVHNNIENIKENKRNSISRKKVINKQKNKNVTSKYVSSKSIDIIYDTYFTDEDENNEISFNEWEFLY